MSTPIDALTSMSPNARAALKRAGFVTLEQAAAQRDDHLLDLDGFKAASLARLRAWQENPDAPQPPAGQFGSRRTREDRIFALYTSLRANGHPVLNARVQAIEEVDSLEQELRGAP